MPFNSNECWLCESTDIVSKCIKCQKPYCANDASKIDPRYCSECMQNVVVTEDKFTRTEEDYNPKTETITTFKTSCKKISFSGIDWMFASKKISELSDDDLRPVMEYHRGMVYQLEAEISSRAVKKSHEMALVKGDKLFTTKKETTIREKRVAKPAAQLSMDKLAEMLIKLGITDINKIQEMLTKK